MFLSPVSLLWPCLKKLTAGSHCVFLQDGQAVVGIYLAPHTGSSWVVDHQGCPSDGNPTATTANPLNKYGVLIIKPLPVSYQATLLLGTIWIIPLRHIDKLRPQENLTTTAPGGTCASVLGWRNKGYSATAMDSSVPWLAWNQEPKRSCLA